MYHFQSDKYLEIPIHEPEIVQMCQCQENLRRVKLDPGGIKPSARGRIDRLLGGSVKQADMHVGQHPQGKDACRIR